MSKQLSRMGLATTIGVELAKSKTPADRVPIAVEEWLDGHKYAGTLFDDNGWDFRRFVLDVMKVHERHSI